MARRVKGWQGSKRDGNEAPIVNALERAGLSVARLSNPAVPDLLVGGLSRHICDRCGAVIERPYNWLFEVKQQAAIMNTGQADFKSRWAGKIEVARTVQEALEKAGKA